jgi:hypothetical protein
MTDQEHAAAAAPAKPSRDAIVDQWVRDVFHGSALGRVLQTEHQNLVLEAAVDLKKRLADS